MDDTPDARDPFGLEPAIEAAATVVRRRRGDGHQGERCPGHGDEWAPAEVTEETDAAVRRSSHNSANSA